MMAAWLETGSGLLPFTLMETYTSLLLSPPKLPLPLREGHNVSLLDKNVHIG